MRPRQPMRPMRNGQRARRGRRLHLRYAALWLAARRAMSAKPAGVLATDLVSREALSPGVQRALAVIFPPGGNALDGERGTAEVAEVPLRRVAEEPTRYTTAQDAAIAPDEPGDV